MYYSFKFHILFPSTFFFFFCASVFFIKSEAVIYTLVLLCFGRRVNSFSLKAAEIIESVNSFLANADHLKNAVKNAWPLTVL